MGGDLPEPANGHHDEELEDWVDPALAERLAPLRREHEALRARLAVLRSATSSAAARRAAWDGVAVGVEAHATAEEEVVYRRLGGVSGVSRMTELARLGHTRTRELVRGIEARAPSDLEIPDLLDELERASRQHSELEEYFLFPLADAALGPDEVDDLLAAYARRRRAIAVLVARRRAARRSRERVDRPARPRRVSRR